MVSEASSMFMILAAKRGRYCPVRTCLSLVATTTVSRVSATKGWVQATRDGGDWRYAGRALGCQILPRSVKGDWPPPCLIFSERDSSFRIRWLGCKEILEAKKTLEKTWMSGPESSGDCQ